MMFLAWNLTFACIHWEWEQQIDSMKLWKDCLDSNYAFKLILNFKDRSQTLYDNLGQCKIGLLFKSNLYDNLGHIFEREALKMKSKKEIETWFIYDFSIWKSSFNFSYSIYFNGHSNYYFALSYIRILIFRKFTNYLI